jgi:putative transposase
MLVFEAKLEGEKQQYERLDEAIRTARFIRNSCIRFWMDNPKIGRYELSAPQCCYRQGVSLGK